MFQVVACYPGIGKENILVNELSHGRALDKLSSQTGRRVHLMGNEVDFPAVPDVNVAKLTNDSDIHLYLISDEGYLFLENNRCKTRWLDRYPTDVMYVVFPSLRVRDRDLVEQNVTRKVRHYELDSVGDPADNAEYVYYHNQQEFIQTYNRDMFGLYRKMSSRRKKWYYMVNPCNGVTLVDALSAICTGAKPVTLIDPEYWKIMKS